MSSKRQKQQPLSNAQGDDVAQLLEAVLVDCYQQYYSSLPDDIARRVGLPRYGFTAEGDRSRTASRGGRGGGGDRCAPTTAHKAGIHTDENGLADGEASRLVYDKKAAKSFYKRLRALDTVFEELEKEYQEEQRRKGGKSEVSPLVLYRALIHQCLYEQEKLQEKIGKLSKRQPKNDGAIKTRPHMADKPSGPAEAATPLQQLDCNSISNNNRDDFKEEERGETPLEMLKRHQDEREQLVSPNGEELPDAMTSGARYCNNAFPTRAEPRRRRDEGLALTPEDYVMKDLRDVHRLMSVFPPRKNCHGSGSGIDNEGAADSLANRDAGVMTPPEGTPENRFTREELIKELLSRCANLCRKRIPIVVREDPFPQSVNRGDFADGDEQYSEEDGHDDEYHSSEEEPNDFLYSPCEEDDADDDDDDDYESDEPTHRRCHSKNAASHSHRKADSRLPRSPRRGYVESESNSRSVSNGSEERAAVRRKNREARHSRHRQHNKRIRSRSASRHRHHGRHKRHDKDKEEKHHKPRRPSPTEKRHKHTRVRSLSSSSSSSCTSSTSSMSNRPRHHKDEGKKRNKGRRSKRASSKGKGRHTTHDKKKTREHSEDRKEKRKLEKHSKKDRKERHTDKAKKEEKEKQKAHREQRVSGKEKGVRVVEPSDLHKPEGEKLFSVTHRTGSGETKIENCLEVAGGKEKLLLSIFFPGSNGGNSGKKNSKSSESNGATLSTTGTENDESRRCVNPAVTEGGKVKGAKLCSSSSAPAPAPATSAAVASHKGSREDRRSYESTRMLITLMRSLRDSQQPDASENAFDVFAAFGGTGKPSVSRGTLAKAGTSPLYCITNGDNSSPEKEEVHVLDDSHMDEQSAEKIHTMSSERSSAKSHHSRRSTNSSGSKHSNRSSDDDDADDSTGSAALHEEIRQFMGEFSKLRSKIDTVLAETKSKRVE